MCTNSHFYSLQKGYSYYVSSKIYPTSTLHPALLPTERNRAIMTTKHQSNHIVNTAITLALFIAPIVYLARKHRRITKERQRYRDERDEERGEQLNVHREIIYVAILCYSGRHSNSMHTFTFANLLQFITSSPSSCFTIQPSYPTSWRTRPRSHCDRPFPRSSSGCYPAAACPTSAPSTSDPGRPTCRS